MSGDGQDFIVAQAIAKRSNLFITRPRNRSGHIINYNVFRNTVPKPTFVGQCVNEAALLVLVRNAAGSRVTA